MKKPRLPKGAKVTGKRVGAKGGFGVPSPKIPKAPKAPKIKLGRGNLVVP